MNTLLSSISSRLLHKAAAIQGRIEELKDKLHQLMEEKQVSTAASADLASGRRHMSMAARRRIAAAQRARWAKQRNGVGTGAAASTKARKRGMSAAGRARLAEAARRRWAKAKASGKNAL